MSRPGPSSAIANQLGRLRAKLSNQPTRCVGIDIGVRNITTAVLGVTTTPTAKPSALTWQNASQHPLPFDPTEPPSSQWIEQTIQTLAQQLPRTVDGERNIAFLSLPTTWIHYQVVQGSNLELCQAQSDQMFQNSIFASNAHQAHWPVVGMQHGRPNSDDQYVVASTASLAAARIAKTISQLGYDVQSILPHGAALLHAARGLTSVDPQMVAMLNHDGGVVAINHHWDSNENRDLPNSCGLCRSLPALPPNLLRQAPTRQCSVHDLHQWLNDIASEINATLAFSHRTNIRDDEPGTLLIAGDVASIDGVDAALATLTNRPVARWQYRGQARPFLGFGQADVASQSSTDTAYATALSLAFQSTMAIGSMTRKQTVVTR